MKWFKKIFQSPKEETGYDSSELSNRVAELRSRITALRNSVERNDKSYLNKQTPVHTPVENIQPSESSTKEQEMMALKAKLLGKKL
jgi:uncharacterized small protein (DUF1192 family)